MVTEGNLNGQCYHDELVDQVIRLHFVQNRHHQPLYMDDNAKSHCARIEEAHKQAQTSLPLTGLHSVLTPTLMNTVGSSPKTDRKPTNPM